MLEAITVYYLAAASLLSSKLVATAPTEIEEIERRFLLLINGKTVKRSPDSHLEIDHPEKYLATSAKDLEFAAEEFCKQFEFNELASDLDTYEALKDNPDFRLDRVEKIMRRETSLPF